MKIKVPENFETITLDEMKAVRLMNRVDTKYVTTLPVLDVLLAATVDDYRVQVIDGECNLPYYTLYFDTDASSMYMEHLHGRKRRQKIRIRKYESSDISFLEIKSKNNKGRTSKQRIPCSSFADTTCANFINTNSIYPYENLGPRVENRFDRITLVNKALTERVTIDSHLRFHNFATNEYCDMNDLVVIELKRDGRKESSLFNILRTLRVFPSSFSKYCIGMSITDESLRHNRFKPIIRKLKKNNDVVVGDNGISFNR
jgi:hypothetical protein